MVATEERLSKSAILGMIAMGVAVLVVANDFTALSVALPAIETDIPHRPHHRAVGHQRLRHGIRRAHRHRRTVGRHVWPPTHFHPRCGDLRRLLCNRRICADGVPAAALPLCHGHWRRDDVARHSRYDLRALAAQQGRAGRRPHPGSRRIRQRCRPAVGRPADRHRRMAMDLLSQSAGRCRRRPDHPAGRAARRPRRTDDGESTIAGWRRSPPDCWRCCSRSIGRSTLAGPPRLIVALFAVSAAAAGHLLV